MPALSSTRPPVPIQRSRGSSNQTQTQPSLSTQHRKYTSIHTVHSSVTVQSWTSVERRYMPCAARVSKKNAATEPRIINCASTSNTSDATRFEMLVWRGGPRSSLGNAPNGADDDRAHEHEARLARRVRYFGSVTGDECRTSRKRSGARRSGAGWGSDEMGWSGVRRKENVREKLAERER